MYKTQHILKNSSKNWRRIFKLFSPSLEIVLQIISSIINTLKENMSSHGGVLEKNDFVKEIAFEPSHLALSMRLQMHSKERS